MSNNSGLPEGFQIESDPGTSPAGTTELPSGFELQPDAAGQKIPYTPPVIGGGNTWTDVAEGVPQAIESGFNRGVLDAVGIPMDAATDVTNLLKSGAEYAMLKAGKVPPTWLDPTNKENVIGTSEWLNKEASKPFGGSLVNLAGDPRSYILQGLNATSEQLGPNAILPTYEGAQSEISPESTGSTVPTAEGNLTAKLASSTGNMGAAVASPSLEGVSPELRDAVANAQSINPEALARQIDAETLPLPEGMGPLRLRAGQATGDAQQISDEKNLRADPDTQGLLSKSITDQNAKLGSSMGEIRARATPTIVQRSNTEHGQAAIDAIKDQDNAVVQDMRAKYKALADQNGGQMPIDPSTAAGAIKAQLAKGFLTKTAEQNPVISEVMDGLSSGNPMSFESFENARTNLASVQRGSGPDAAAAAIVRNGLENMPLSSEAANLKGLADTARAAAKARFDTIEQNPAYAAAINDNVPKDQNGLHVIGAPSPLADNFMDRYFLGNGPSASKAYIARMQTLMQPNPDFSQSVEAAALNKLRAAAGLDSFDTGEFRAAQYRNERNAMEPKINVLMSPQSANWTDQLKRVAGYVNDEGKAATVNRANTALTLQRLGAQYPATPGLAGTLADYGTDVGIAHTGPVAPFLYAGKKIGATLVKHSRDAKAIAATRAAKLKFAQDATAPGAGIDIGATPETAGARASGGKVDHEVLVSRLMSRWHAARKSANKTTEPLLRLPDETIAKALEIAGRPAA